MAIVTAIAAVVSAVGSVVQTLQARKNAKNAQRFREQQLEAQKEERAISQADARNKSRIARQRAAREKKIKIATIQQSAENSGAGGSSGELGSVGVIGSNFSAVVANAASTNKAIQGINAARDAGAEASVGAANALNKVSTFGSIATAVGGAIGDLAGSGVFNSVSLGNTTTSGPGKPAGSKDAFTGVIR